MIVVLHEVSLFVWVIILFLGLSASNARSVTIQVKLEVKYKALADTTIELMCHRSLIYEFGITMPSPSVLWCDNLGATYLSANPVFHA